MILSGFLTRVLLSRGTIKGRGTQRVTAVSGIARNNSWSCKWWEWGWYLYSVEMQRNAPPLHYLLPLLSFSTNSTASWLWGKWKWIFAAVEGKTWIIPEITSGLSHSLDLPSWRVTAALIWLLGKKDWVCGLKEARELQLHTGLGEVVRESGLWLAQWSLSGCSPDIAWSIFFCWPYTQKNWDSSKNLQIISFCAF